MAELYFGSAPGYGGAVNARIRVEGGRIAGAELSGPKETKGIGDLALAALGARIAAEGAWDVDTVSGATVTSAAARCAVREAMANAGLLDPRIEIEEIETDAVVVGCGVSGMAAGVSAAERALRVVMLERSEAWGGSGIRARGGFFVETYLQQEAGETFTVRDAYDEAMFFGNYLCDPILMRRYLGAGAETVRWLNRDHGAGLTLAAAEEGRPRTCHVWEFPALCQTLRAELAANERVQIRFGTAGIGLIADEKGAVCGLVAKKSGGGLLRVRAKAVYLATGGYLANTDMVWETFGDEIAKNLIADADALCDGGGLRMAWAAGAGSRGGNALMGHGGRSGLGGRDGSGIDLLFRLPILWVNRLGQRFMDEGLVRNALFFTNLLLTQRGYAFVMFDQASLEQWKPQLPFFDADFAQAVRAGAGFVADSVGALARAAGMDGETLSETVADYNRFVAEKRDTEFCKSAENLLYAVCQGPFYALRCRAQARGTLGGVRINDALQAVTPEGKTIPGLYVGGADAGGLYNGSYAVQDGTAAAWALTSGRLAGEEMAKYIRRDQTNGQNIL